MKKVLLIFVALVASNVLANAQTVADSLQHLQLEEVVISSTRTGRKAAIAHSNLDESQIKKENMANNIPSILHTLPSMVAYSEGGTGVGNTQYRIRGTDANRINVTLNGMPVNNPESQDVFWVNIPDLASSLKSIQVQRGVGTSTNGAASFGGSISLQTKAGKADAYGEASTTIGSYNTYLSTLAAGSGILKSGLSVDGRYSRTTSDGYIRNGDVNHKNGTINLSHYTAQQLIRLIYINGIQHTGITWKGIDPDKMKEDRRYNSTGEYKDDAGNIRYYDNETDNYYSHIVQAIYSRQVSDNWTVNLNFSYNNGYGYYENYKKNEEFEGYGLPTQVVNGSTYKKSDLVRRKLLSNDLYVGMANVQYVKDKLTLSAGGMYSYFDGSHYGRVMWVKHNEDIAANYEWYRSQGDKRDMNLFAKVDYQWSANWHASAEMQYRYVDYRIKGTDDDRVDITSDYYYNFYNPKVGLTYSFLTHNEVYASFGISNREPLRADLKDYHKSNQKVKSERLYDYELGYRYQKGSLKIDANLYYMDYKDQLVATGRLSDSGYRLQENVSDSYRMGIELSASYQPFGWLQLEANTTWSRNKIKDYTVYYTTYDNRTNWGEQKDQISEYIGTTNISFAPDVVSSGIVSVYPFKDFSMSLVNKYVGKMYYDNTSNSNNRLKDYYIANFVVAYAWNLPKTGRIEAQVMINNIFDKKYEGNAWSDTYRFADGSAGGVYRGLYPQAPCHAMARVGISF